MRDMKTHGQHCQGRIQDLGVGGAIPPPIFCLPLLSPLPSKRERGSGGVTPGKFLKMDIQFGAFWCILALLTDSLDSPVL